MKVITLTLNPAIDVHARCDDFGEQKESIASILSRDMGGKGVNLSRALLSCGKKHKCLVVVGDENGEEFVRGLKENGLDLIVIQVQGRIRENVTIHQKGKKETRLSFEGFQVGKELLSEVKKAIPTDLSDTIVTFTGSAPKGIDKEKLIEFLQELKARGAKLVLDSRSLSIDDIISLSPWLIKPNEDEAKTYSGKEISDEKVGLAVAREFREKGVENVLMSLGSRGAVLSCKEGDFYKKAPSINAVSTIGAGDSMIAGFIARSIEGDGKQSCLNYAIACGSSACMEEGTNPPKKERIEELLKSI